MASEHENMLMSMSPSVLHPRDMTEAWTFKKLLDSDAVYVAGGTLLRTQWESGQAAMPKHLIDLSSIPGLKGIEKEEHSLAIGALTPLSECRKDEHIRLHCPMLVDAIRSIAAISVRNVATIGGNIVSRVGDCLPVFIVCQADFEWNTGLSPMTEDASEWTERLQAQLPKASHLLTRIHLPLFKTTEIVPRRFGAFHKVGRREAFTPSLITVALNGGLKADGTVGEIRVAAGGGQTIPHRLFAAEKLMKGQQINRELLAAVHQTIVDGYKPKPDPFATEAYRKKTAANLIVAELWKIAAGPSDEGRERDDP
ncbi:FAD binding domain-containing protein [Cohnella silvisoli]|uniref:FAD binding domain-containing protein n=1 Tax=Cohnella silvisoli TaxID=2873699 RepID=A0ABV1KV21_9BACL|nr:FAD binding domain-containing protein [Cohnella silvisoli]MCD9023321.1 FAD binding domain-containing protein [Cohnella silvisoli]